MDVERLTLTTERGIRLSAILTYAQLGANTTPTDDPDDTPHNALCACFAHCFACGKDFPAAARLARALSYRGITSLRFDFMGLGAAEGDFSAATWSTYREDFATAVAALEDRCGRACDLFIGHSFGGTVALDAAIDHPDIGGIITIAAPFEPAHITRHFSAQAESLERDGVARINLAGKAVDIGQVFVDSVRNATPPGQRLSQLHAPLLILHAPSDHIVEIDNARKIFERAPHPKSFVALHATDHLLSRPSHTDQVAALIDAWSMPLRTSRNRRLAAD
ncbi:MAG: alpha/beta hydrolase [Thioalkalivibrionaceae bacterium]